MKRWPLTRWTFALTVAVFTFLPLLAMAAEERVIGPESAHWGRFVSPNGPVAELVVGTYNIIFWICLAIYILVQGIIIYAIFAFRKSKKRQDKDAAKFSHNTALEVIWTVIPVLICVFIGVKSYWGISFIKNVPEDALQVDVIAYQFNWDFDYPDLGISSPMTIDAHPELAKSGIMNPVKDIVVPQGRNVVLNITARDVLHAVYVPALGIKSDAIPGRITYSWFNATKTGDYLGQCAELCGPQHGEMYFNVKVLPEGEWETWVDDQRQDMGMKPIFAKVAEPTEETVENAKVRVAPVAQ